MAAGLHDSGLRSFLKDVRTCPQPDVLRLALDARTKSHIVEALTGHLDTCPKCCQRIEQMAAQPESLTSTGDAVSTVVPPEVRLIQSGAATSWKGMAESAAAVPAQTRAISTEDGSSEIRLDFLQPSPQPGVLGLLREYEVHEVLGRGGMGIVLRALDPALGRAVAMKVLLPELATNASACERFVREARAAAAINHKNIVAVYAVDDRANPPFFVMQLVEGESLAERISRIGKLSANEVIRIALQVAAALNAAHEKGMVHRDIKPANILLGSDGAVHLSDFGLVKLLDSAGITRTGVIAGTPEFMSPEQAEDRAVDGRSDLFGWGAVMYLALVGDSPFRASSAPATLRRICEYDPPSPRSVSRDVPKWLSDIVLRLLEKDRRNRIQSAKVLSSALSDKRAPNPARSSRRNLLRISVTAAALTSLVILLNYFFQTKAATVSDAIKSPLGAGFVNIGTSQTYLSLSEAIVAASDGDTIDVCVDGDIHTDPIFIYGKSITLRAAPGCHPVLMAKTELSNRVHALTVGSDLTLHGIDFGRSVDRSSDDGQIRTTIRLDGASLSATNCSFNSRSGWRSAIRVEGGDLRLSECSVSTTSAACIGWFPESDSEAFITNCELEGPTGLCMNDRTNSSLSISRSTWRCTASIVIRAVIEPDKQIKVVADNNQFETQALLALIVRSTTSDKQEWRLDETYLRRVVQWIEAENDYSEVDTFSSRAFEVPPRRLIGFGPTSTDQWLAIWRR